MGKHDEAVTGTLCAVDLDAWTCNRSTRRNISEFKGLVHEETDGFHMFSVHRGMRKGTSVTGRVGEIGLQCISFYC